VTLRKPAVCIDIETRIWVVVDPGPRSEIGDVCWVTTLDVLAANIRGGLEVAERHATIYLKHEEALTDARARLVARAAYDRALGGVRR
jgi:hypothetical protein